MGGKEGLLFPVANGCVARVLRDMVDSLQDARHEDIFWTIRQIVKRRDFVWISIDTLVTIAV